MPAAVIAITSVPSPLDYVLRHFSGRGDRKVETPMQLGLTAARVRALVAAGGLAMLVLTASPARANTPYLERPEVLTFMSDLQSQYGFDIAELERVLGDARYEPRVVQLIGPERPSSAAPVVRSWPGYRARFLTRARINAGVQYWQLHEDDLRRAQAEFGVPAQVILGILGVETAFGRNTGSFRTVDALATIAFDGPRRQEYFREELKELLLLSREMKVDPLALRGSYAGAMGLPQFMPSSYRRHAVDFDGNGSIDLLRSPADAIASVASYLKAYGWTAGEAARARVRLPAGTAPDLISGLARVHTVEDLKKKGVKFSVRSLPKDACSVIELPAPRHASKYLVGFGNFEAVTRYNRSTFYATAVLDLADAISSARKAKMAATQRARVAPAS
jgi:membrane-bound lytic murein transglycosylase B